MSLRKFSSSMAEPWPPGLAPVAVFAGLICYLAANLLAGSLVAMLFVLATMFFAAIAFVAVWCAAGPIYLRAQAEARANDPGYARWGGAAVDQDKEKEKGE